MNLLLLIGLGLAFLEWYGEYKNLRWLIYITKPFVMICILTWIVIQVDFDNLIGNDVMFPIIWFLIGMFFCLLGDIFLMGSERYFMPGLVSFLFGHIFFIIGLGQVLPKAEYLFPGILLLMIVLFVSYQIFKKISEALDASSLTKLKIPVGIYSIVITIMLYSALITLLEREWNYQAAVVLSFGALMFYVSDVLNALKRFVRDNNISRILIMVTYHIAQFSIAIGAVLHTIYRPDS